MFKNFVALLIIILSITVSGQVQSDNSAAAKAFTTALIKEDFATAYGYFGKAIKDKLREEDLPKLWKSITEQFGEFEEQRDVIKKQLVKGEKISVVCKFKEDLIALSMTFDETGKIQGFFFDNPAKLNETPSVYMPPDYANSALFVEKEMSISNGRFTLPAILSLPNNKNNVSAVVLVHGSGPNDRDATHINPANKIFKDFALGLASKGIAVLRYDKRTLIYKDQLAKSKNGLTVNEETVDDAIAAVELLRKTKGIDPKKIYVLGHSLGGMMIPRIGLRDKKIAGLIILAGSSRPLEDSIVEQYKYLTSLKGSLTESEQNQIMNLQQLAEATKKIKPTYPDNIKTLLDLPVSYWADLNAYNPTLEAQKIQQPLLVLQGEKDYQVTIKDFQMWKDYLGKRKNVSFKLYPSLTHIFMKSNGASPSPADYELAGHVDLTVIVDIANWILKVRR
jgi:uncharacterized protein